ncbi:MAG: hypothetical protein AAF297_02705 [Planctomycetota bacterium]
MSAFVAATVGCVSHVSGHSVPDEFRSVDDYTGFAEQVGGFGPNDIITLSFTEWGSDYLIQRTLGPGDRISAVRWRFDLGAEGSPELKHDRILYGVVDERLASFYRTVLESSLWTAGSEPAPVPSANYACYVVGTNQHVAFVYGQPTFEGVGWGVHLLEMLHRDESSEYYQFGFASRDGVIQELRDSTVYLSRITEPWPVASALVHHLDEVASAIHSAVAESPSP